MRRFLGAVLMAACAKTAVMAAHPNFRENESRWYIQVSFNAGGPHGFHYIGETWASRESCEAALNRGEVAWGNVNIAELAAAVVQQYDKVTDVKYFCGVGSWQDQPSDGRFLAAPAAILSR